MNRKKFAALAPDRAASFFVGRLSIEDSPCDANADCRIFCTMRLRRESSEDRTLERSSSSVSQSAAGRARSRKKSGRSRHPRKGEKKIKESGRASDHRLFALGPLSWQGFRESRVARETATPFAPCVREEKFCSSIDKGNCPFRGAVVCVVPPLRNGQSRSPQDSYRRQCTIWTPSSRWKMGSGRHAGARPARASNKDELNSSAMSSKSGSKRQSRPSAPWALPWFAPQNGSSNRRTGEQCTPLVYHPDTPWESPGACAAACLKPYLATGTSQSVA